MTQSRPSLSLMQSQYNRLFELLQNRNFGGDNLSLYAIKMLYDINIIEKCYFVEIYDCDLALLALLMRYEQIYAMDIFNLYKTDVSDRDLDNTFKQGYGVMNDNQKSLWENDRFSSAWMGARRRLKQFYSLKNQVFTSKIATTQAQCINKLKELNIDIGLLDHTLLKAEDSLAIEKLPFKLTLTQLENVKHCIQKNSDQVLQGHMLYRWNEGILNWGHFHSDLQFQTFLTVIGEAIESKKSMLTDEQITTFTENISVLKRHKLEDLIADLTNLKRSHAEIIQVKQFLQIPRSEPATFAFFTSDSKPESKTNPLPVEEDEQMKMKK